MKGSVIIYKRKTIILVLIVLAIIFFGAWGIRLSNTSSDLQSVNKFHPSDYMNDQKSFNTMFNNQQLKTLKINMKNDTVYMNSRNGHTDATKNLTNSYNQLPSKHSLLINHVSRINQDQYKLYWSTMYNTRIHIKHHIYMISPMGNKDHIFNKYNLNHEGYFIISSKKEPQIISNIHELQHRNKSLLINSNNHMM